MLAVLAGEGRQLVTEGLISCYDVQTAGSTNKIYENSGKNIAGSVSGTTNTYTAPTATTPAYITVAAGGANPAFTASYISGNESSVSAVSFWMQPGTISNNTNAAAVCFGNGSNTALGIAFFKAFTAGVYQIAIGNGGTMVNTTQTFTLPTATTWVNVHCNIAASTDVYINGVLLGNVAKSKSAGVAQPNLMFAYDINADANTTKVFGGCLVYNRTLLPQEVQQNYLYYADRFQRYY